MKLGNDKRPIVHGLVPFFQYFLAGTINELNKGIFTGESAFIFSVFADLSMKALHDIGGVNDTPEFLGIFEVLR